MNLKVVSIRQRFLSKDMGRSNRIYKSILRYNFSIIKIFPILIIDAHARTWSKIKRELSNFSFYQDMASQLELKVN